MVYKYLQTIISQPQITSKAKHILLATLLESGIENAEI
jgi:hypothetical protein